MRRIERNAQRIITTARRFCITKFLDRVFDMARKPLTGIEARKIFGRAENFYWSYERLCTNATPKVTQMAALPAMVLSSFASELYLKCLHAIDSGFVPAGHELDKLFAALPSLRRQTIETLWNEHIVKHKFFTDMNRQLAAVGAQVQDDLPTALKVCGRGFMQLRYEYEDSNFVFYISDLPEILRLVILAVEPTWESERPPLTEGLQK